MVSLRFIGFSLMAILTLGLPPLPVDAATAPNTIGISATVQATCLNTATAVAFGFYAGVVLDATSTVTVTCTNTTAYTVGISAGASAGATVSARKMTGGVGVFLNYGLFRDVGRSLNWGTTAGTDTLAGTATGSAQPITVYGRVAAGQFVTPGAYTDTVTATVTY